MEAAEKKLISLDELVRATGIKKTTWRHWLQNNQSPIKPLKFGRLLRFRVSDLESMINGGPAPTRRRGRPTKAEAAAWAASRG